MPPAYWPYTYAALWSKASLELNIVNKRQLKIFKSNLLSFYLLIALMSHSFLLRPQEDGRSRVLLELTSRLHWWVQRSFRDALVWADWLLVAAVACLPVQRVEHRASGVVGTWSTIEPSPVPSATQRVNRATILNETREGGAGQGIEPGAWCCPPVSRSVHVRSHERERMVKPFLFSSGIHFISDRSEIQCENEIASTWRTETPPSNFYSCLGPSNNA